MPTQLNQPPGDNPFNEPDRGPLAAPGRYTVSFAKRVESKLTPLGEPQTFEAVPLGLASLPAEDRPAVLAFQQKTARLQRAVAGALQLLEETGTRLNFIQRALLDTPKADPGLLNEAEALETRLQGLQEALTGDPVLAGRNEPTPPAILDRLGQVIYGQWTSSSAPTQTQYNGYSLAAEAFAPALNDLRKLVEVDLKALEDKLEAAGAPWTPGRIPTWQPE